MRKNIEVYEGKLHKVHKNQYSDNKELYIDNDQIEDILCCFLGCKVRLTIEELPTLSIEEK